jgi:hypothetical protein
LLKLQVRQDLQEGAREGEMHAGNVLVPPEAARYAIQREEDLLGFPRAVLQQLLKVSRRLMEI